MADYVADVKVVVDQSELDAAEKKINSLNGKTAKVKLDVTGGDKLSGLSLGGGGKGGSRGGGGLGLGTGSLLTQYKRAIDKRQDYLVKAANTSNEKLKAHYEKGAKEQGRIAGSTFVKAYKEAQAKGSGRQLLGAGGKYLNEAKSKADFKIEENGIKRQEKLEASVAKHAENMAKRLQKANAQKLSAQEAYRQKDYKGLVQQQKDINKLYGQQAKYAENSATYKAYGEAIKRSQNAFDDAFIKYANKYKGMSQADVDNLVNLESNSKQSVMNAKAISAARQADAAAAFREKSAYSDIESQQKHINSLYQARAKYDTGSESARVYSDRIAKEEETLDRLKNDYKSTYGEMSDMQKYRLKNMVDTSKLRAADIQMQKAANDLNIDGRDIDLSRLRYQQRLKQFSRIGKSGKYNDEIADIDAKFAAANSRSALEDVNKDVEVLFAKANLNGDMRMTFWDSFKSKVSGFAQMISPMMVAMGAMRVGSAMLQNVEQIDTAMTELRKVTDNSEKEYADYQKSVRKTSYDIGSTQADLIQSSATFARLGYSLSDSAVLGRNAALYAAVGDEGMTADDAARYMVSIMKGFNIAASDSLHVVDALNEVGNNFAISSTGIGESLQRSGAALSVGGNSFEEAIGLTVAANDATQNAEATGTALKTISLRLRGAKVELAEAGEETEGMAISTASLRDTLLQLSGVDILENPTTFKSTYQVMSELAEVWDDLSDISQASIVEKLAGKRGASFFASMMKNWEDAEGAYKAAMNSAGSAERENENILSSIEGRKRRFKSSFESLSSDLMDSDMVKAGISLGTGVVRGLDAVVNATNTGVGKVVTTALFTAAGIGGKTFVNTFKDALSDKSTGLISAFTGAGSAAGGKITTTAKALGGFLMDYPIIASIGVAAAGAAIAYKVWDANTEQLAETHQKLYSNLTNASSAQQQMKTLQDQIVANEEQIQSLEGSAKTSLSARTKVEQLQRQNRELEAQVDYQEKIVDNSSLAAAYNVRTALRNQSAYQSVGKMEGTSSGWAKFGLAFDSIFGDPNKSARYDSEQEHFEKVANRYIEMQDKLNKAYEGDFEQHAFKDQAAAIDYYNGEVSSLGEEYSGLLSQHYEYLDALTDPTSGGIRKGFEEDYYAVRDGINKALRLQNGEDSLLNTMFGYSEYDGVQEKLAQLALSGKLTGEQIKSVFPEFAAEAERASLSVDKIASTMNSLASGSSSASAALALVSDNLEVVNSDAQRYEETFSGTAKAAKSGFSATGLTRGDYNTLGAYTSAMDITGNGIILNYEKYAAQRNKYSNKTKADLNSEIKLQETLLNDLQKQQKVYEDRIANARKAPPRSDLFDYISQQEKALENINSSIDTVTGNIGNLRIQRAEVNGLNSDLAQYINTINGDYEATANSDTVAKSMSDMINSVNEGRVSSAQAREFAELYNRGSSSAMKNSEVGDAWKQAYENFQKFYDIEEQYNKNKDETTYKATLNAKNISDALSETQKALGVGWLDDSKKTIEMTTSDVNSFAKAMGISASAASDLINTLNSYGYDVKIRDTSKTLDEIASNANKSTEALAKYGDTSRDSLKIYADWKSEMLELRAGSGAPFSQEDNIRDMDEYISRIQKAREGAKGASDGQATEYLNGAMMEALRYREEMNRGVMEENIMNADPSQFVSDTQSQVQALQQLQSAREELNATTRGSEDYGIGDLDVEGAQGNLENATTALANYIQESGEYADTFGTNIDDIESKISGMSLGELAEALHLDLSQLQIDGTENAVAKAQEAGAAMAQAIGESVANARASLDDVLGAGNYTLSLDAQGNITSVNVSNVGQVEVPAEAKVTSADTSGVPTASINVETPTVEDLDAQINYSMNADPQPEYDDINKDVTYDMNAPSPPSYPNITRFITYKFRTVGSPPSGGGGLHGTAHASGSWGAKGGMALTGELGRELVVYGSKWYTVGDDGAEFTKIPHGAIIFNHKQTEEIFKNGYVTSGGGRGKIAHANGTAFAEGNSDKDIDFIEIKLNRLADAISNYTDMMNLYEGYKNKNIMAENAIYKAQQAISENQAAKTAYLNKANSIGLSSDYVEKIKNGSLDISTISDEDLKKKIEDYQKWYEKALKVDKTIIDLNKQIKDLRKQEIKNITDNYSTFLNMAESRVSYYEALGKYQEETTGNIDYWNLWAQGYYNSEMYSKYLDEAHKLEKKRDELYKNKNGSYNQNHEAYLEFQTEINKAYEEAYKAQLAVQEVNNQIRELNWVNYTRMLDSLEGIGNELTSVYNLIDNYNSFDEAMITDNGIAKLGLLVSSIKNSRQEVANYNTALKALDDEYKNGIINQDEYLEQSREIRRSQLDVANSAQRYRSQIISLIRDGIREETNAYSELIDKRQKALDKQKEADDYAREISDKTREISKIEAQIAALSGDDTNATRAKIRSLESELAELNEDLADKRREHEYDVINDAYSDELEKFKEIQDEKSEALTASLEAQNKAIEDALSIIGEDYSAIYNNLSDIANEFGITLTGSIVDPWKEATNAVAEFESAVNVAMSNVSIGSNNYRTIPTSASSIETNAEALKGVSNKAKSIKPKTTNKNTNKSSNTIAAGVYKANASGVVMLSAPNGSAIRRFNKGDSFSSDGKLNSGYVHIHVKNASEDKWGWILKSSITKAAHGNANLPNGLTLFDEKGFGSEVLLTKEGALAQLSAGTKVFNDKQKDILWKLSNMDLPTMIGGIKSGLGVGSISGNVGNTNVAINYDSMLTVNGDVTRDALPRLEEILRLASEKTRSDMSKTFKKIGIG